MTLTGLRIHIMRWRLNRMEKRDLIDAQQQLIRDQQQLIGEQHQLMDKMRLEAVRELRGLVCAWILHLEQPELDLRDDLHRLDAQLGNQAAALEEHVV